jgi:hypothetical protein
LTPKRRKLSDDPNHPGQALLNDALPEDMRDYNRTLDAKGLKALMQELTERHPEQYRDVAKRLSDIGREVSYSTGSFSIGPDDLRTSVAMQKFRPRINYEIQKILRSNLTDKEKGDKIGILLTKYQQPLEEAIYRETLDNKNPLALQVLSGSRGKPSNIKALVGGDLVYMDHRGRIIPVPILHSYSEGLTPAEYFSGSFGARAGVVTQKLATADAGYFGKKLAQAAHRLIVTAHDAPPDHPDYGIRGLPADVMDPENEGALLALPVGGYPRNTILTPKILRDLQVRRFKRIAVRSPIVDGPPDGGVYAKDVGIREKGTLPPLGDSVGIAAAQAIAEPVSQAGLSERHKGGVATGKATSGFEALEKFIDVPKIYGGAAHSDVDGKVQSIEDAPAGGKYVTIGGVKHYIGSGFSPIVKRGQEIEAGDRISDGLPNPAMVVEHKGIGEGRRYFVHTFKEALKESGIHVDRRNVELLAKGLINHVHFNEEYDHYLPGDTVPYSDVEHHWRPRDEARTLPLKQAVGMYLERPALHHTVGTRLKPSMIEELNDFQIKHVHVHPEPPPFRPVMIRGMENLHHDPDWMVRMLGSHLEKGTLKGVHEGSISDTQGSSYVPALANPLHFGQEGLIRLQKPTGREVLK